MKENKEWQEKQIKDLGDIVSGGTPKTKENSYWRGEISWITPKDMSNIKGKYILKGERSITKIGLENSSAKLMPKDSVLFTSRAPIGYIGIAKKELSTNQGFKSIVVNSNNNNEFVYYLLKYLKSSIENVAGGSTFKEISGSAFKKIKIKIPLLFEQRKIATILKSLDDKIELNNKMNETLEDMAQNIFKEWFVNFNFPNEEGKPYKDNGGKMIESELGMIPDGWRVGRLKDILSISSGKRPNKKSKEITKDFKIPVIGASGVMAYTKEFNNLKKSLVIGRVGTLGIIQRINKECWLSDNTLIINTEYYEYSYQNLKMIDYTSLNRGSTQPLITQSDMKNKSIIIPKNETLKKYEFLTNSVFNKVEYNLEENLILIKIRDTLLPKLMSGEVRV